METRAFKLTDEEIEKLDYAHDELERSRSDIVRSALDYFFNELLENEIALKRLKDPSDKLISSDDILKNIDSD